MEILAPIKYILLTIVSLFFLIVLIRIIMKSILQVYYEEKYNYFVKLYTYFVGLGGKDILLNFLKKEKQNENRQKSNEGEISKENTGIL